MAPTRTHVASAPRERKEPAQNLGLFPDPLPELSSLLQGESHHRLQHPRVTADTGQPVNEKAPAVVIVTIHPAADVMFRLSSHDHSVCGLSGVCLRRIQTVLLRIMVRQSRC